MSFSALDGLPMGTRCGTLDPGVILFCSGMVGVWITSRTFSINDPACWVSLASATTSARRWRATARWRPRRSSSSCIAYSRDRLVDRGTRRLGRARLHCGRRRNSPLIREQVCQGLTWLGVRIDPDANQRGDVCISPEGCIPSVWVIPTDEEAVIASHTLAIVRLPAVRRGWRTAARAAGAPALTLPLGPGEPLVPYEPQVVACDWLTRRGVDSDGSGMAFALKSGDHGRSK